MKKYRPSNGTEGGLFISDWCCNCKKDNNKNCPILARTLAYDIDDERYPPEWQYGEDNKPKCTEYAREEIK